MHHLDMMAALCQLVGKLVNKNTIPPKVVRRIKCGHHAKTHERVYSNTPSLLMERIPFNLMTMPYSHQDSILGPRGHLGLRHNRLARNQCNVNRCATMASTNTPSIFANDSPMRTRALPPNRKYATSHSCAYRTLGPSDSLQMNGESTCHRHQSSPGENYALEFP